MSLANVPPSQCLDLKERIIWVLSTIADNQASINLMSFGGGGGQWMGRVRTFPNMLTAQVPYRPSFACHHAVTVLIERLNPFSQ